MTLLFDRACSSLFFLSTLFLSRSRSLSPFARATERSHVSCSVVRVDRVDRSLAMSRVVLSRRRRDRARVGDRARAWATFRARERDFRAFARESAHDVIFMGASQPRPRDVYADDMPTRQGIYVIRRPCAPLEGVT